MGNTFIGFEWIGGLVLVLPWISEQVGGGEG